MSIHVKRVHRLIGHRFLLAVGLVLAMLAFSLVLVQPPKAGACPTETVEFIYYTDESMTVACGRGSLTCHCHESHSGCQTPYYTERWLECW